MKKLGLNEIWSFCGRHPHAQRIDRATVARKAPGHLVHSYFELATKVAELQFRNPDHVLMFRGQARDHRNVKDNTTLHPSLFRSLPRKPAEKLRALRERYATLERAEAQLVTEYQDAGLLGAQRLQRHRMLRWAILQHYEICATPLLDVTHSVRIAASFASHAAGREAFVFVLAVPNLSGAITASAEAGLQIVRLSSVCPPSARRPHLQEGYLLGEYPDMDKPDQKGHYGDYEIDFGRRLVAKFKFVPASFWGHEHSRSFPPVGKEALYPTKRDPLQDIARRLKASLKPKEHAP